MLRPSILFGFFPILLTANVEAPQAAANGISPTSPATTRTLHVRAQPEQSIGFNGLPIALGDTYKGIEDTLGKLQLEYTHSVQDREIPTVRLSRAGVMLFFDDSLTLNQIRVGRPFGGNFSGVKVGQEKADVVRLIGPPDRTGDFGYGRNMTFFYDRVHFVVRCEFGPVLASSGGYPVLGTRLAAIRLIRKP